MNTTFNGNISQLCANLEREISENDAAAGRHRREIEGFLSDAETQGQSRLSASADARADNLFADIERLQVANRRLEAQLARAREVEGEERQNESRLNTVTRTSAYNDSAASPGRRTASFSIGRNERTYRPDTDPHGVQFLRDVVSMTFRADPMASDRLLRHSQEEMIERPEVNSARESRAAGDTTTTNWSGLVVPAYLVNLVAPQISALRPFADLCCVKHDLPPAGMSVNFSKVTTGASVALQTSELTAVATQTMDDTLGTAPVQTAAGMVNLSRQAIDRGTGIEQQTFLDLNRKYAAALDSTLLNQASTGVTNVAQTVTYTSASPTAPEFWPFLEQADSKLESALLGVSYPDYVVMHSRRWHWLASQVGTSFPFIGNSQVNAQQGGMVLTTEYGPSVRAILNSGLKVVVDNNIATNLGAGTNQDEVYVVASNESVHLFEDPNAPVFIRAEQPNAPSLGVLLVLYGYFAYATRYVNPVSKISGTGLIAPSGF